MHENPCADSKTMCLHAFDNVGMDFTSKKKTNVYITEDICLFLVWQKEADKTLAFIPEKHKLEITFHCSWDKVMIQ